MRRVNDLGLGFIMFVSVIITVMMTLAFTGKAWARPDSNESAMRLDDMVVTGTRTPKTLKDSPIKTEVIQQQQIRERRLRNAAEAIVDMPGVTLSDATGKTGQSAVMQGLGGEHVLVLVDGAPILQNSSAGVDLTQIPATDIERIEVVKGGASALYGGQAMGGVINIITKKPDGLFNYDFDMGTAATFSQLKAQVRGQALHNAYKVSLSRDSETSIDQNPQTLTRDTPDVQKLQGSLWFERRLGEKHKLSTELGYGNESATTYWGQLQPNSSYVPVENRGSIERRRLKLGYNANLSETQTLSVFVLGERVDDWLSMEDNPVTPFPEALKKSRLERQRFESQWDVGASENHILTLGAVAENQFLDQSTETAVNASARLTKSEVEGKSNQTTEVFLQDDWLLDQQEIISGVRITRDQAFGWHVDPKVNWLYQFKGFADHTSTFRASVGSGYRIPNLKERFYLLDHRSFAGYVVYGNENLRPEESISAQMGLEISNDDRYSAHANVFYNRVRGLISTREVATGTTERAFRFENLDQVLIQGLELSGRAKLAKAWQLAPSFTYTRAFDEGSGLFVANRPFYVGQLSLIYQLSRDRGNLNATYRYTGDAYANLENTEQQTAFSVLDVRLNRKIQKNIELYLGIRNLLDVRKQPLIDGSTQIFDQRPAMGRVFFIGLSAEG